MFLGRKNQYYENNYTTKSKKQESSRKTSISALLTMPKPLTVWILYIENPKDIRKLLGIISEFSKVAGYKINIHKSLRFYILRMKNQKEQLRNQSHSPLQQK